jgi:hypothetical protein
MRSVRISFSPDEKRISWASFDMCGNARKGDQVSNLKFILRTRGSSSTIIRFA